MKKLVTIFLAAAFLLVMYVPVSAAEWDFYGSARVATFWTDVDNDDPAVDDTMDLNHNLQGNARIGANVKNDAIGGRFEYGTGGGNANIRLLYGTVDLGPGQLLVGQAYAPFGIGSFISKQVYATDNGLLEFVPYVGRRPMGQYSVGGFKVALVRPVEIGDPEVLLPQVQASYDLDMGGVSMNFAGVFQTYDLDNGDGDTLNAYAGGTNIRLTMMDPMYLNFGGFYGQNVANFGQASWSDLGNEAGADITDPNNIEDADTYGAAVIFGGNLEPIGFELGAGYRNSDNGNEVELYAYYGQVTVPLSQDGNAFIVPEVGYFDYENEDEYYAGLKWQINF
ncbi:MAG: hypothetical protein R6T92_08610 [Desulfosalsimonadaceae bacterium]